MQEIIKRLLMASELVDDNDVISISYSSLGLETGWTIHLSNECFKRLFSGQNVYAKDIGRDYDELYTFLDGVKVYMLRKIEPVESAERTEVI